MQRMEFHVVGDLPSKKDGAKGNCAKPVEAELLLTLPAALKALCGGRPLASRRRIGLKVYAPGGVDAEVFAPVEGIAV